VDDEWITDHTAPQESDGHNNINNVLYPENITKAGDPNPSTGHKPTALMAGVTPSSTTAGLAGEVPKEEEAPKELQRAGSSDLPGSFPETPAVEKSAEESQSFGVAPLPATAGIGNPIQTVPGEKVPEPSTFTDNTITSAVTTDKESYEKSGSAEEAVPTQSKSAGTINRVFGMLPASLQNLIPESSLPMGVKSAETDPGYTIQSAGPESSTAELAGKVPLEPTTSHDSVVPDIVTESQKEAGFEPEAAANPEAVAEKSEMEKELESKVPEEPATSEGTAPATEDAPAAADSTAEPEKKGISGGEIAGIATGAAASVAAAAGLSHHESSSAPSTSIIPPSVQQSIDEMNKGTAIDSHVPDVVQESIAASHQSPEAAASSEAVAEKSAVEAELLKKVPHEDMGGEPAPSLGAALTETAPAATALESAPVPTAEPSVLPVASAADAAPLLKSTETPLKEEEKTAAPVAKPTEGGLAAPGSAPAMTEASKPSIESRDVSPMTRLPGDEPAPLVTTGLASASTPATSTAEASSSTATPVKANGEGSSTGSPSGKDKRKKRLSGFFDKFRSLGHHKDKK
jgi:hypothetical protein